LNAIGVRSQGFPGDLLVDPASIRNKDGRGLRVFSTLVDADPGSNPANWQWVAGSGADAAPYFRVFNPILQGEKFDPDDAYVRRWVPELAPLPAGQIQQPWRATPLELSAAGVELGKTYPEPIIDHRAGRERALKAYAKTRAK
jgi:deoxyribodipyrimidine photo-lyase